MTFHDNPIGLAEAPLGRMMRVRHLRTQHEIGLRLRELGICEDALVRCIHHGYGNVICQVQNTRIAIDLALAKQILVSGIDPERIGQATGPEKPNAQLQPPSRHHLPAKG